MILTGRAALAALAGAIVVGLLRTPAGLLAVNVALVVVIAADAALAASVRRLAVRRSGATSIHVGSGDAVTVSVANNGGRPLRGMVRDAWRPSAGASPARFAARVAAGGEATFTTTLSPVRRGDVAGSKVAVRSLGPLGLAGRQRSLDAPWVVRVLPAFYSRRHLPGKLARLRELDGLHRSLIRGQGSEFDSLRKYVLGDDVRSIDWRSSARHADVLVRTWRPERDRRIILVLDTGRTSAGRVGSITRLDASMDAGLLLGALASRAGDRVDLLAVDRKVRARVVRASRLTVLSELASAMALVEPDLVESDVGLMAATVFGIARQRCLVVLLTDLNPAAIEQGLLPRVPLITARHQLMVAAVSDPRLAEMTALRADVSAIYGAAAAERARAERARVAAQLRRHGVEVVDAPPLELAPRLADAYLNLKAAGRL